MVDKKCTASKNNDNPTYIEKSPKNAIYKSINYRNHLIHNILQASITQLIYATMTYIFNKKSSKKEEKN